MVLNGPSSVAPLSLRDDASTTDPPLRWDGEIALSSDCNQVAFVPVDVLADDSVLRLAARRLLPSF